MIMANQKFFHFTIFLAMLSICVQSQQLINSRKLDDETQNKCGSCPCNNPCNPPPVLSPPPPSPPPPSPPPPPQKPPPTPPSNNCPPPPPSGGGGGGGGQYPPNPPYIYINGPPGDLYPIDQFSGSGRSFSTGLLPFLISGALLLIALW